MNKEKFFFFFLVIKTDNLYIMCVRNSISQSNSYDFLVPWQGESKDSKDSERGFAGNSGI